MNLLLVKLSSLGDIVHTFPAVSEALVRRPDVRIDWLVDREYVDLVVLHGGVRTILPNDALPGPDWWRPGAWPTREGMPDGYDVAVDAQGLFRSAILARGHHAPVVGADGRSVREWGAHLLHDRRVFVAPELHASDVTRRLMGAALGYDAPPLTRPTTQPAPRRPNAGREALLLHGTKQRSKDWPLDYWVDVARFVSQQNLTPVVTWGNEAEQSFCRELARAVPATSVLDRQPIGQIARLIDRAKVTVTVDTGLGHLADWRGCPTVMLFQASNPDLVGPSGPLSRALWVGETPQRTRRRDRQHPPRHPLVTPDVVKSALAEVLAAMEAA